MLDVSGDLIRSIIERVEAVEVDIKSLNSDKSDIYTEARGQGLDVAILRKLIKERAKPESERAEEEAMLDLYRNALARTCTRGGA